jgi:hypothetical protein
VQKMSSIQQKVHDALVKIHAHTSANTVEFGAKTCMFCKNEMDRLVGLPKCGAMMVFQCKNSFAHICVEDAQLGRGQMFALNYAPDMWKDDPKFVLDEYHYKLSDDGVMHMLPPNFKEKPDYWTPMDTSGSMGAELSKEGFLMWGKSKGHSVKNNIQTIDGEPVEHYGDIDDEPLKISAETAMKFIKGMKHDNHSPYIFHDYQTNFIEPKQHGGFTSAKAQQAIRDLMKASKMIASPKMDGYKSNFLVFTDPQQTEVLPYVPLPVLTEPRSAWGKKMKEKIDALKAVK